MRKLGWVVSCLLMQAAALIVLVGTPSSADTTATTDSEIRSALEKWRSAFNDRDETQICDIFATDLVANYQGAPERDYASLCQLLRNAVQDPDKTYRYSLKIDEIFVYGETAVVRLLWRLEIEQAQGPKAIIEEPAVDIFRHQADGSWKISRYLAYPASP